MRIADKPRAQPAHGTAGPNRQRRLVLRCDNEMVHALRLIALREGVGISAIVRQAVREYMERHA